MDEQNAGAAAAPITPEAATAQKAALMADPEWRAAAMDSKGSAWQQMVALNETIAGAQQAAEDADEAEAAQFASNPTNEPVDGDEDPGSDDFLNRVPERGSQYQLGEELARLRQAKIEIDPARDAALREGLIAAQVPSQLAKMLYSAAVTAALRGEQSESAQAAENIGTERALRAKWGKAYDQRVQLAVGEARRIYDGMPDQIKGGRSYEDWMHDSGLARNRQVVELLFNRARARRA